MKAYAVCTASTGYRDYPAASRPDIFKSKWEAAQCLKVQVLEETGRKDDSGQFLDLTKCLSAFIEKEEAGFEWTLDCGLIDNTERCIDELITYHIFEVDVPS